MGSHEHGCSRRLSGDATRPPEFALVPAVVARPAAVCVGQCRRSAARSDGSADLRVQTHLQDVLEPAAKKRPGRAGISRQELNVNKRVRTKIHLGMEPQCADSRSPMQNFRSLRTTKSRAMNRGEKSARRTNLSARRSVRFGNTIGAQRAWFPRQKLECK